VFAGELFLALLVDADYVPDSEIKAAGTTCPAST
jgi:hypothetical protein